MSTQPESLKVVREASGDIEATNLRAALEEAGIECQSVGDYTAGFRTEVPGGLQILVKAADYERAQAVLAQFEAELAELDWSQVDVGDPE